MGESNSQFEKRKSDHIQWSMQDFVQTRSLGGLDQIDLIPEALPEINLQEVSTEASLFSQKFSVPFFVSSMTAGHQGSVSINQELAGLSQRKNILVGVGSQRKELWNTEAETEWKEIRKKFSGAHLAGNLGLAQLIQSTPSQIQKLIDSLGACAFFVHTNPLQEALQKEGTTQFKGGLKALENLAKQIKVPIILKEVGCGFSAKTLEKIKETGVYAVDVSGLGGTHWGRIEGARFAKDDMGAKIAQTFSDWGMSTVESVLASSELKLNYQIWASGGIRTGLDIAKMLSLGAKAVGLASPWLAAIVNHSVDVRLDEVYEQLQQELKIAMFCTGCANIDELTQKKVWKWRKKLAN